MEPTKITADQLQNFEKYLVEEEKSTATQEKYMRDVHRFVEFAGGRDVDKSVVMAYKSDLTKKYAIRSANSMLASLNSFLRFVGWCSFCVKQFKVQKDPYCPQEKELRREEYMALINVAGKQQNERLSLLIQTICGTGIRVSELQYITVEAVKKGEAIVSCKGKTRRVFIVTALRKKLLGYAKHNDIFSGMIFVTKKGKPLNRSNIWREMKSLCEQAGVERGKVFPHNLRHLFARAFYRIEKDIAKLADILGHSNINTTRIYIMTTGEEHQQRMEKMRLII